jgi:hypothetical protein
MFNILTLVGFHTWLSLVALASGIVVVHGLLHGHMLPRWTALFLATAVATNVTGFLLPFTGFLPSHAVGIISSVVLLIALIARYVLHLRGGWRSACALCALFGVYFLAFVAIAQTFAKVPGLAGASQTPFAIAEAVLLIAVVVLAINVVKGFRPVAMAPAP